MLHNIHCLRNRCASSGYCEACANDLFDACSQAGICQTSLPQLTQFSMQLRLGSSGTNGTPADSIRQELRTMKGMRVRALGNVECLRNGVDIRNRIEQFASYWNSNFGQVHKKLSGNLETLVDVVIFLGKIWVLRMPKQS